MSRGSLSRSVSRVAAVWLLALTGVVSEPGGLEGGHSRFAGDCIKVDFTGDLKDLIADCVKMELSIAPLFGD
jgi:hypothetical protein